MTPPLLGLIAACIFPTDDTGTDDTGTPSETPVSLDALFVDVPLSTTSCQWSYSATHWFESTWLVAQLALPEADRLAAADVSYDRTLTPADEVTIGAGAGAGEISVFDCSDVVETMEGVQQWDLVSGHFVLDAVFEADHPEWTCTGDFNPVYDGVVSFSELVLADSSGARATAAAIGPIAIRLGQVSCGG